MKNYKRQTRELVYEGSILDIYKDHMVWENGHEEDWDFVSHRKGAAAVVAVKDDGKLLMVCQYRNALGRDTIEIPAGARDSVSEDTAVCAARELEEETGFKADKLEKLISLKTTVAFCDEFIDVYVADNLVPGERHLDPGESIEIREYELEELLELIYAGIIQDSKTVSAVLAYAWKYRK